MIKRIVLPAAPLLLGACALLGFGPPVGIIEGVIQQAPTYAAAPFAEICVYGVDTTCHRADGNGRYRIRLAEQTVWLRFRAGTLHPHRSDTLRIVAATRIQIDCAISNRMVVSPDPLPCLAVRQD